MWILLLTVLLGCGADCVEAEFCDGLDNDCDGAVDEGYDADGDGALTDAYACQATGAAVDCDDQDPAIHPGAEEVCDGLDNDCSGQADDRDEDGDGYGVCEDCADEDPFVSPGAAEVCDGDDDDCDGLADEGWDDDGDGSAPCAPDGDCDDASPEISPDHEEVCDGLDNDCDDAVDEGWDDDADGAATCRGDCDDSNPEVYPGAAEICDGLDNDCQPETDELADGDGDGYTICDGDCDDASPESRPGAEEICDGLDNDCSGHADELPECFACEDSGGWLFCTAPSDWFTARDACAALGGQLAVIEDAETNDDVAALGDALTASPLWIGLQDRDSEGEWIWVDGIPLDGGYSAWGDEAPDDDGGEDCACTNWGSLGTWNDYTCDDPYPFVCE